MTGSFYTFGQAGRPLRSWVKVTAGQHCALANLASPSRLVGGQDGRSGCDWDWGWLAAGHSLSS